MIKPYLYGGIVLLIVGLSSFIYLQHLWLTSAQLEAEAAVAALSSLEADLEAAKAVATRKEEALAPYIAKVESLTTAVTRAAKIINDYSKRDTLNEKCLDLSPPDELIRLLDKNSLQGQGDLHSPKSVPASPN